MTLPKPAVHTPVAPSGPLPLPFLTTCLLTDPRAEAMAARGRAAPRTASTHDRSVQPPSPVYTAATAWRSPSRWSVEAPPEAHASSHAAGKNCDKYLGKSNLVF